CRPPTFRLRSIDDMFPQERPQSYLLGHRTFCQENFVCRFRIPELTFSKKKMAERTLKLQHAAGNCQMAEKLVDRLLVDQILRMSLRSTLESIATRWSSVL